MYILHYLNEDGTSTEVAIEGNRTTMRIVKDPLFLRDDTIVMMLASEQPAAQGAYAEACQAAGFTDRELWPEETFPGDPDVMAKALRAAKRRAVAESVFKPT